MQAKVIYDTIEGSGGFYNSPVEPSVRSRMNVPFTIPANPDLEAVFIKEAAVAGLVRHSILKEKQNPLRYPLLGLAMYTPRVGQRCSTGAELA
jgi:phosphoserine aminotransferase